MKQVILTLNAGSSSLKFALFPPEGDIPLATGLVDRIGADGEMRLKDGNGGALPLPKGGDYTSHTRSLATALVALEMSFPGLSVAAVGHRVVHGGPDFAAPVRVDETVLSALDRLSPFAPLHQPHNLAGIRAAIETFPHALQVACFDTAFHRGHSFENDAFALPRAYFDKGIRRYGFHGLSYDYVSGHLAMIDPDLAQGRVIIAHLGNGASMCALNGGRSVTSTMGFSALDGLAMGTRCGQIDPGALLYLMQQEGMDGDAISDLLYKRSGLLGLSGLSHDMRELEAADTPEARQAVGYFIARIRRELGGLTAVLGGLDALIFTAGIGENSAPVRAAVCKGMDWLGLSIDETRNEQNAPLLSKDGAKVRVMVLPTNEELVIARGARRLVADSERPAA
ncbi:acetate/propionate family kinase [Tabrizicola sp. J26]|uniref:acetate/propionate family kinase n=1 Tax=Alitabrizicola rongguiensis TaxID=2909234 RepID=UPI001F01E1B6|nr:acetate/propionate family kinase [Tabrizicola rongguiensis]MCF1710800.1 acetate/propionate family kinase [Tabrizicola rongguiensis]